MNNRLLSGVLSHAMSAKDRYFRADGLIAPYRSVVTVGVGDEIMKCLALRGGWFMVIEGTRAGDPEPETVH